MIQRKQTLWLLAATIFSILSFKFSFYTGHISGANGLQTFNELTASFNILLIVATSFVALLNIIAIFLFKDRNKQMMFCTASLVLSGITIGLFFWQMQKFISGTLSLTSIVSFVVPVFIFLAIKGIYDDEKLIKSVDRLR